MGTPKSAEGPVNGPTTPTRTGTGPWVLCAWASQGVASATTARANAARRKPGLRGEPAEEDGEDEIWAGKRDACTVWFSVVLECRGPLGSVLRQHQKPKRDFPEHPVTVVDAPPPTAGPARRTHTDNSP